jgi:hypothetical protein
MKINVKKYKKTLDRFKHRMSQIEEGKRDKSVANMSFITHTPVLAVCEYMLTYLFPNDPELLRCRERLIKFYKYSEIVPFETPHVPETSEDSQ